MKLTDEIKSNIDNFVLNSGYHQRIKIALYVVNLMLQKTKQGGKEILKIIRRNF